MGEEDCLSFEEFTNRNCRDGAHIGVPKYNNFFMHFAGGDGARYREKPMYQRFSRENPEKAASLCDKIQNQMDRTIDTGEALRHFDAELYEAYKIMKSYGASDREVFSA